MGLPDFDCNGNLPPGEYTVSSWSDFVDRYGYNQRRLGILGDIRRWLLHVQAAGCRTAWIDGSFICANDSPGDYDACWDVTGVDRTLIDPHLIGGTDADLDAAKATFGGDIRPDLGSPPASNRHYIKIFQLDRLNQAKGIVRLDLRTLTL
jgi:hypothetical protein